jgi:hypothetical protein
VLLESWRLVGAFTTVKVSTWSTYSPGYCESSARTRMLYVLCPETGNPEEAVERAPVVGLIVKSALSVLPDPLTSEY